jgi:hypothetical protein
MAVSGNQPYAILADGDAGSVLDRVQLCQVSALMVGLPATI